MSRSNGRPHLRVLVIEDSIQDAELIQLELERSGYKIVLARVDTEAALRVAILDAVWDVILCDYGLPNYSAEDALEMIRDNLDDIPFILISGTDDEDVAVKMLKLGANDFIYKSNLRRLPLAVQREISAANARMAHRLEIEKSHLLVIEAWGRSLELRDVYTHNHTIRVTDLALRFARALRVSSASFRSIRFGALLHDVGKMGIPDAILLKRDALTQEERNIMQMHPAIAFELLAGDPFLRDAINIPYCHHEKWDGSGYPRGLIGADIPFEARLFSLADVYDALTTDRPYRKSWPEAKARAYIKEESGKSFDPDIVPKFLEVIS